MYRCALAACALAAGLVASAAAQTLRHFPPNTLRGALIVGAFPAVTMNGVATTMSPGSRVRDANNMNVTGATLVGSKLLVHYTLDIDNARIKDVWILTADEAAIKPWPRTLEEARTWSYDTTTNTWTKP